MPPTWGEFNIFDPDLNKTDRDVTKNVPVTNPITDDMFNKYLQWQPVAPIDNATEKKTPGLSIFYANTGEFGELSEEQFYAPFPGSNLCGVPLRYGDAAGSAFLQCNYTVWANMQSFGIPFPGEDAGQSQVREVVQRYVDAIIAWAGRVGSPYDSLFGGFHVSELVLSPPTKLQTQENLAILIIEVGKIKKLLKDPKAEDFTFNVEANSQDGSWTLLGGTTLKLSPPGQRDIHYNTTTLQPENLKDWPQASATFIGDKVDPSVDVTVTFKTMEVKFKKKGTDTPKKES
jgi:hypothetical protein